MKSYTYSAFFLLLSCGFCIAGESAPTRMQRPGEMATRQVRQFGDLEQKLSGAINARDAAAIEELLTDDYALRVSNHPEDPTNRAETIAQIVKGNALSSHLEHVSALDYGDVTIVSFSWILNSADSTASSPRVFIVDTWKRIDDRWKIAARYASPVGKDDLIVPGDMRHVLTPNKKI